MALYGGGYGGDYGASGGAEVAAAEVARLVISAVQATVQVGPVVVPAEVARLRLVAKEAAALTRRIETMSHTFRILGLQEDGSSLAAKMQASARRRLQVVYGESVTVLMEVRAPSGAPVDLSGATFAWHVGMAFQAPMLTLTGEVVLDQGPSVVRFVLSPSDWGRLPVGRTRLAHEIWMDVADQRVALVPPSPFDVLDTLRPAS